MPDLDGKLTETETVRLTEWYKKNWDHQFKCPICGSDTWQTGQHIVETRPYRRGILGGGPIYAYVQVFSVQCGYTVFLNAQIMGILDPPPPPASPVGTEKTDG